MASQAEMSEQLSIQKRAEFERLKPGMKYWISAEMKCFFWKKFCCTAELFDLYVLLNLHRKLDNFSSSCYIWVPKIKTIDNSKGKTKITIMFSFDVNCSSFCNRNILPWIINRGLFYKTFSIHDPFQITKMHWMARVCSGKTT